MSLYKLTIVSLMLFLANLEETRNLEIFYSKELIVNVNELDNNQNVISKYNQANKSISQLSYILKSSKDFYTFELEKKLNVDINKIRKSTINSGKGSGKYIYDITNDLNIHKVEFFEKDYLVEINNIKFETLPQKKEILGSICYKAIGSYNYNSINDEVKKVDVVAWYSPEFSIQYGPIGINNLPGLVLQLDVGKIRYNAVKINEHKSLNLDFNIHKENIISENEFELEVLNIIKKFRNRN